VAKICLCLTAKTLKRNLDVLDKYRNDVDIAELRADYLDPDERFLIRRFPEQAGIPVILTIRRDIDGGQFAGGEGARVSLMARGLAYAETDRRRNFAYIDIEEDLNVPSLEEAARTFGTRIIRSYHNMNGTDANLSAKIRSVRHSADEIVKIAVTANSTEDVLTLLRAKKDYEEHEKILIAMGHYGVYSRILAEQFGSLLTYVYAPSEPDIPPAAPGQINVTELTQLYRFRNINKSTGVYGVTGFPLKASDSPVFFNSVFEMEGNNAVYVPFPADSITSFMKVAEELNVAGLSVTVPYKESVIPFLNIQAPEVQRIGACNTLSRCPQGWVGANTDTWGFSDSLLTFLGRPHLKRQRVTVIGAGGAARAVVSELHRLGAKVLILNRTITKARQLAVPYRYAWGGLDDHGMVAMEKYRDIIIQTTSAGMEGLNSGDPVPLYNFCGREVVMDLVYKPEITPFLQRAMDAGCQFQNGYDMLIRQARHQYTQFMEKEFPEHFLTRVHFNRI